jgi:hypothetical protein
MKNLINKKIDRLFIMFVGVWQLLFTPIKSFALEYTPLEPNAFPTAITTSTTFSSFLNQVFQLGLAVAAALAVVMIVWGGVEIMLSESVLKKNNGKERIQNAIYGLLLALFSWLILYTINPEILNFKL